jgi:hypothetical protein
MPNFAMFNGDDSKTTYEHIGQFLAQINDVGMTDIHKIRLFRLLLSGIAFNWFTYLAPNSIDTWPSLKQKFHDYFYNGEVELRLSDLTSVRQKYNETVLEYLKRFREPRNKCYDLTIGERDLVDLAFKGLSSHQWEKMEGHDFTDINQVLQHVMIHEKCARNNRPYSQFKEARRDKDKQVVNLVGKESANDSDAEVCVAVWVDTPRPISCSFLKPNVAKKNEMR